MSEAAIREALGKCARIIGPRLTLLKTLTVSAIKLRTTTFQTWSEGQIAWPQTGLILLSERLVWLVTWFVNPLSRHLNFLTAVPLSMTITVMMLITGPVIFWGLTRWGGKPSLNTLLNFHLISSGVSTICLASVFLIGMTFSPGLENDIRQIRHGTGEQTRLYQAVCAPAALQAELYSVQRQINLLTGEYDALAKARMPGATRPQLRALMTQLVSREASLSPGEKLEHQRLHELEKGIQDRVDRIPVELDIQWVTERYAGTLFAMGALIILLVGFLIWTAIFLFKLYLSGKKGGQQILWTARVIAAAAVAGLVSFTAVQWQTGARFVPPVSLEAQIRQLEISARGVEPICGPLNSRGLW